MDIKPALVKELRERTGAGMMECKKALVETNADIDAAAEYLRKAGAAKADKKSSRVAAEGRIAIRSDEKTGRHVVLEVNSETDFVAKDDNFRAFVDRVAEVILVQRPANVEELLKTSVGGKSVEELRLELVTKVGENISVRRFDVVESRGNVASYVHGTRIGVLVDLEGGGDVPQQHDRIVVALVERDPRKGAAVARRPLREDSCLPIAGRSNDGGGRDRRRRPQSVHERRTRDRSRP